MIIKTQNTDPYCKHFKKTWFLVDITFVISNEDFQLEAKIPNNIWQEIEVNIDIVVWKLMNFLDEINHYIMYR